MLNNLTQVFNNFLNNVTNGGEWTYIIIGTIIFIVLLIILADMIRR